MAAIYINQLKSLIENFLTPSIKLWRLHGKLANCLAKPNNVRIPTPTGSENQSIWQTQFSAKVINKHTTSAERAALP